MAVIEKYKCDKCTVIIESGFVLQGNIKRIVDSYIDEKHIMFINKFVDEIGPNNCQHYCVPCFKSMLKLDSF